jgi:hypothetical protein
MDIREMSNDKVQSSKECQNPKHRKPTSSKKKVLILSHLALI